mmetsp:Transcript_11585/g.42362  ORF Transcript_11585/g.42362 Transcript_11585/m.42362 type:complete len:471 (-) Transcript_11585:111-1523(-)
MNSLRRLACGVSRSLGVKCRASPQLTGRLADWIASPDGLPSAAQLRASTLSHFTASPLCRAFRSAGPGPGSEFRHSRSKSTAAGGAAKGHVFSHLQVSQPLASDFPKWEKEKDLSRLKRATEAGAGVGGGRSAQQPQIMTEALQPVPSLPKAQWPENERAEPTVSQASPGSPISAAAAVEVASAAAATPIDFYVPVRAFHIAKKIDLEAMQKELQVQPHIFHKESIILSRGAVQEPGPEGSVLIGVERYMVVYRYGSVVFFNYDEAQTEESIRFARKFAQEATFEAPKQEDYGAVVRPSLSAWSALGQDCILLKRLDMNNIRVISSVLGQSVALDHYSTRVDNLLKEFSTLNSEMEKSGELKMSKRRLFQLVAANNSTLADLITKLRILERSDTAWQYAQYGKIWETLRVEFELRLRFEGLDFKLDLIKNTMKFFLEIQQNQKSDTLEWIIILLITGEICVSLYDIFTRH